MLKKNKREICYISVPVAPPESMSKHCLWRFEVLLKIQNIKNLWKTNLSFCPTCQLVRQKCNDFDAETYLNR